MLIRFTYNCYLPKIDDILYTGLFSLCLVFALAISFTPHLEFPQIQLCFLNKSREIGINFAR